MLTADGDPDARVLWLGDPEVLPLGGHPYCRETCPWPPATACPTWCRGGPGTRHPSTDRLDEAVDLAVARRTERLGRILGSEGIRYVVVPTRSAPEAFDGIRRPPPAWLADALAAQLDLEQVDTDRSLIVYRNQAWRGEVTAVPAGTPLPVDSRGAARTDPDGRGRRSPAPTDDDTIPVEAPGDADLVAAVPAADGWTLRLDGEEVATDEAYGWALHAEDPAAGTGTVAFHTSTGLRVLILLQPLLWVLAVLGRRQAIDRARRRDHPPEVEAAGRRGRPPTRW